MNQLGYQILHILYRNNHGTALNSITINSMIDNNINVTKNIVSTELKSLVSKDHIHKGFKAR